MGKERTFSQDECKRSFEMLDALRKRAYEIAPLCTNIGSQEKIIGMWNDGEYVRIEVWGQTFGNDMYEFPMEYFSMTTYEIKKTEQAKAEIERIRIRKEEERERMLKKKAREQRERRTYERLKKKFG